MAVKKSRKRRVKKNIESGVAHCRSLYLPFVFPFFACPSFDVFSSIAEARTNYQQIALESMQNIFAQKKTDSAANRTSPLVPAFYSVSPIATLISSASPQIASIAYFRASDIISTDILGVPSGNSNTCSGQ